MSVQLVPNTLASRTNGVPLARPAAPARVIWYQPSSQERAKSSSLVSKFSHNGMDVRVVHLDEEVLAQLAKTDLVMVVVGSQLDREINHLLDEIRANSRAPVVLLTDSYTLEWSISTLVAGADAVMMLSTPDEVIMARCKALLRRWMPS
jgi:DNA-binding response OmpR family regulator